MKPGVKRLLSFLFIAASIGVVIWIAFSNQELENAWEAMGRLDLKWVAAALLCWGVYTFFDGLTYWAYLHRQHFRISVGRAYLIALIGFYYSNITPSAAGGQPMQVNSMRKAGIPVGYGTMAVTVRFIVNQFMISFLGLVFYLFHADFVNQQLQGARWWAFGGWLFNFLSVPLVLLAAFRRDWIQRFSAWVIRLLEKIRLVKNREMVMARVTETLDTYHTALRDLMRQPGQILLQFLIGGISLMGLMLIVVAVYHAFGLYEVSWSKMTAISTLLYLSASVTPLPGASGAQEGGFLLYYKGIFKDGTIGLALLVWRFFTFYLFLIVGVFTVILENALVRRERRRQARQASAAGTAAGEQEPETRPGAEPESGKET